MKPIQLSITSIMKSIFKTTTYLPTFLITIGLSLGLAFSSQPVFSAERISDFALLDQNGAFHQISYYNDLKAIALMVYHSDNSISHQMEQFQQIAEESDSKNFIFMMLNPFSSMEGAAWQDINIPVLMDESQLVSESLQITRGGEVLLIDPNRLEILYRGPVKEHLAAALQQLSQDQDIKTISAEFSGPAINYPAQDLHRQEIPSYSKDIAPILIENCVGCHRESGVAPFAMDSWGVILGWSPMIREVILTKRMPPGQIDPHVGNFKNDMNLTVEQSQQLIHWIEEGAPNVDGDDPLSELNLSENKWAFGEPDLIIKVPPQTIPPTGAIDFTELTIPLSDLKTDRWVRGSQYVPSDLRVLHHAESYIVAPESIVSDSRKETSNSFLAATYNNDDPDGARIAPYVPGATPELTPENTGGLLRAGSTLALQLHYATIGRTTVDESEIGFWFYDENNPPEDRMVTGCTCLFPELWKEIPAFSANHEMQAELTIDKDAYLYSILPQMHYRGKAMIFTAHYPDGTEEQIINIANYNYNWQISYDLAEPMFFPAGTKIVTTAYYDNSSRNKFNPDSSRNVPWGQESWNELLVGVLTWKYAD